MKTILATTCAIAFSLAATFPVQAKHDHDDHDRDHDHDHDHNNWRYYHARPWYHTSTVVIRTSPRHYRSVEADVQRALSARGYYRGPIDGDIGPGSRAAIRSYQYRHGLRATGYINDSLLRSLNI